MQRAKLCFGGVKGAEFVPQDDGGAAVPEIVVLKLAGAEQAGEVGALFFFEQRDSRLCFSEAEAVVPVFALGVVIQS